MLAKSRACLLELHELIKSGKVEKKYLAGVAGSWQAGKCTISAPLKKNTMRGGERLVEVSPDGKSAITHFSLVQHYPELSLVEAVLETGRTHQIRVHAAYTGHPIAGDEKYGDAKFNKKMKQFGLKRLFLHAHFLSFIRPGSDTEIIVSSPLSPELQEVLNQLEGS
jgi:23S rRNA pseudouridine955/2504/2580 synthase